MVSRAIFVLLSALAGMALFIKADGASASYWMYGFGIGAVTGGLIVAGEYTLHNLSFGIIVGGTAGLAAGLVLTGLVEWVGGEIFDVQTFLFHIGGLVFLLGFPYLGLVLGARFGKEKLPSPEQKFFELDGNTVCPKVLDTSVIIDGRVADLCETRFLEGTFLVPHFILDELQHIADSSDSLKRARGRRGLDILNKIQKMGDVDVRIIDEDFPHVKEVDAKLIVLAKKMNAKIVTNDLNLNKVAELQGIRVLAVRRRLRSAVPAGAARPERQHHAIAGRKRGDAAADALDDTRALMPEHRGQAEHLRREQVGVADAGRVNPHDDLVGFGISERQRFERRWRLRVAVDPCLNSAHGPSAAVTSLEALVPLEPLLVEIERAVDLDLERMEAMSRPAVVLGDVAAGIGLVAAHRVAVAGEDLGGEFGEAGRAARPVAVADHHVGPEPAGGAPTAPAS